MKIDGRADRTIAPGKTEEVKLTIATTRKRKGKFTKSVRVTTNDAKNRNPTLACEGNVKVPFEMQPTMITFSQIERSSEAQKKTFKITRGEGGPLSPELVPSKNENVKATLREIVTGEEYELDVELSPPWPNRAITDYLTLKTGVESVPEEKLRVYARIAARLRTAPSRFTIPREREADMEMRARLIWSGDNPGQVLEVKSTDPKTPARLVEENGQQYVVLNVPAGYVVPPSSRAFVTIKTDDPAARTAKISIYGARPKNTRTASKPKTPRGANVKPIIRPMSPPVGKPIMKPARVQRIKPGTETAPKQPAEHPKTEPAPKPVEKPAEKTE